MDRITLIQVVDQELMDFFDQFRLLGTVLTFLVISCPLTDIQEIGGNGVLAKVDGIPVAAGNLWV